LSGYVDGVFEGGHSFVLRPLTETDLPYVLKTWTHTRPTWGKHIAKPEWDSRMARTLSWHIRDSSVEKRGLCDAEYPDWLVGFVVATWDTLDFVYVRTELRGHGLAKRLLAALPEAPVRWAWPTREGRKLGLREVSFWHLLRYI